MDWWRHYRRSSHGHRSTGGPSKRALRAKTQYDFLIIGYQLQATTAPIKTTDEETAKQLEEMVNGALAMAELSMESNPKLANIWESQKVERAGNVLTVQIGLSIRAIKKGIEKEMDKNI